MDNTYILLCDIVNMQEQYIQAKNNNRLTKKAICDICIPFRDKYALDDKTVLSLARNEFSIKKIKQLIDDERIEI